MDIIIPVYDGYDETMRCIYSVLNSQTDYAFEVILINDHSPNDELTAEIEKLSQQIGCIKLVHRNVLNCAFIVQGRGGAA